MPTCQTEHWQEHKAEHRRIVKAKGLINTEGEMKDEVTTDDKKEITTASTTHPAEYPQDVNNNGIQGSGSRLMESGDSAMYPPGQKFGGSAMLSDSVDIRSCVLLGNPQPFRTWI